MTLTTAGHFTKFDLEANRSGSLSKAQQTKLKRQLSNRRFSLGAWVAALVTLILGCIAVGKESNGLVLLIGIVCVVGAIPEILKNIRISADLADDKVSVLTKPITLQILFPRGTGRQHQIRIGVEVMEIKEGLFVMLNDGEFYTVYYTPRSKIFLAIETS
jgi:hypothetical protein